MPRSLCRKEREAQSRWSQISLPPLIFSHSLPPLHSPLLASFHPVATNKLQAARNQVEGRRGPQGTVDPFDHTQTPTIFGRGGPVSCLNGQIRERITRMLLSRPRGRCIHKRDIMGCSICRGKEAFFGQKTPGRELG